MYQKTQDGPRLASGMRRVLLVTFAILLLPATSSHDAPLGWERPLGITPPPEAPWINASLPPGPADAVIEWLYAAADDNVSAAWQRLKDVIHVPPPIAQWCIYFYPYMPEDRGPLWLLNQGVYFDPWLDAGDTNFVLEVTGNGPSEGWSSVDDDPQDIKQEVEGFWGITTRYNPTGGKCESERFMDS